MLEDWIKITNQQEWKSKVDEALRLRKGIIFWKRGIQHSLTYEELKEKVTYKDQTLILHYGAELPDPSKREMESLDRHLKENGVSSIIEWMDKIRKNNGNEMG